MQSKLGVPLKRSEWNRFESVDPSSRVDVYEISQKNQQLTADEPRSCPADNKNVHKTIIYLHLYTA